jgi:DNA-binding MarR family transcriptional regulator
MPSKPAVDPAKHSRQSSGHGRWEKRALSSKREPTLDQIFAEPIVRELMHRDETDEAAIRHLLDKTAAFNAVPWTKDRPSTNDPHAIFQVLDETVRMWYKRYNKELRRQQLTLTRALCTALTHLALHEGTSQVALAQILNIAPISLVRLLDRLEAAGLVARLSDPESRRGHVLALTMKARPLIKRIDELTTKMHGIAQSGMSDAEASRLLDLLCRMRSNLMADVSETRDSELGQQRDRA